MNPYTHASQWAQRVQSATTRRYPRVLEAYDVWGLMGECSEQPDAVVAARAQKAALILMKQRLAEDPSLNQRFNAKTGLSWLDKLLTVARLKELAGVKIVKAGKSTGLRYNIIELTRSFYGKQILKSLGFSTRRFSMTAEELARIEEACKKIKLTLPRSVEPTTTERFFADDGEETSKK